MTRRAFCNVLGRFAAGPGGGRGRVVMTMVEGQCLDRGLQGYWGEADVVDGKIGSCWR